ncbi:MAG: hypothetical protein J6U17_03900 [Kiritimatiellae bacterium]|nr:hypothetical protein [Kiritimatiellia bacterium]
MTSLAAALAVAATFTRPLERVVSTDPIMAQSVYDCHAVGLMYATPLEVDYEARPYRLVPGLCELPEVSSDGLRYLFRMRRDAPSSSLAAGDVVRALMRLRDPDNASPGGWTMKSVSSIRALDDDTFEIVLSSRSHVFPWMMAMSYAGVPAADGSETGPYRLASWRRNHEMVFRRRFPEPGRFDEVRYLVVSDASTQWLMFLKGEVDYLGEIARDNWDAVVDAEGRLDARLASEGVVLHGRPALEVAYFGFNMRDGTVGRNRKLRQALCCAFDFPTWRKFMNNRVLEANGPVPPGVDGRVEEPAPYRFDIERAKALLAEAGYPGGIDPATGRRLVITLSIGRAAQEGRETGELLASFFERIGVKLELSFSTWSAFLQAVNEGRVQMYSMAWVGDYPDAENFLQLFYSKNTSPGPNHSCYENADYDAEFEAAMASESAADRNVHWRACQEILREDCPWLVSSFPMRFTIIRPTVRNYVPSDFPYGEESKFCVGESR